MAKNKEERKGIKCPECSHGVLKEVQEDYYQCDICLIYYDRDTLEPLDGVTLKGETRRLGYEVQLLKATVIDELLAPFRRLFRWLR